MKKPNKQIPSTAANVQAGKIPNEAGIISAQASHYIISFRHYNDKLCELALLEKNKLKECIQVFKRVTQSKIGELQEQNIDQIRISGTGEYKKLFNKLPPNQDIQILEHKLQEKARIFYFLSGFIFNVTAITNNHLETDKTRH